MNGSLDENQGALQNNDTALRVSPTVQESDTTSDVKKELNLAPETNVCTKASRNSKNPPTKTLSYLSTALAKQHEDSFFLFTARQRLLVFLVFILGIKTGTTYVSYVQRYYGYGKDPLMEKKYLPYGPNTHLQTSALLEAQRVALSTRQQSSNNSKRKQIRLNRDNPKQPVVMSTLFGLEYNHVVGRPEDDTAATTTKPQAPTIHITKEWYALASHKRVSLAPSETDMLQSVALKVHETIPELHQRASQVSWGGPHNAAAETNWWSTAVGTTTSSDLSALDGGHLLYAYLFIMKWNPHPSFPFRLCGENGCPPERAIAHSLQWREAFKPWLAPPSLLQENINGFSYHRGFSHAESAGGKHTIVWLRLGHTVKDNLAFFRGILHSADRAIGEALVESNGETGKFNVIIDCKGFSLSGTPTLASLKQGVTMLQDHYPNRLGMVFLANLSRPADIFLKVVLSLITKEVRDKVKVLPNHDKPKSMAILHTVVDEEYIPDWLGGTDTYRFNVEEYYPPHHRCTEEEAHEFLTTMPYHAT